MSPQTPKSPKTRGPAKGKGQNAKQRRASKAAAAAPAPPAKPSTDPRTPAAPAAAAPTPATAPTPAPAPTPVPIPVPTATPAPAPVTAPQVTVATPIVAPRAAPTPAPVPTPAPAQVPTAACASTPISISAHTPTLPTANATAPITIPTSAPAPPQAMPSVQKNLKRPREEEEETSQAISGLADAVKEEVPASKRAKGEWDTKPDLELTKSFLDTPDNIETSDQACDYLEEVLGQDSDISPELRYTLAQALSLLSSSGASASLSAPAGDMDPIGPPSPKPVPEEQLFRDFVDFTAFSQEDEKPDTPSLAATSSANPSPDSGSETEGHSVTATAPVQDDYKTEMPPDWDPFQMWQAIDGGESGYYTSAASISFNWEAPPSNENFWAMSTSSS